MWTILITLFYFIRCIRNYLLLKNLNKEIYLENFIKFIVYNHSVFNFTENIALNLNFTLLFLSKAFGFQQTQIPFPSINNPLVFDFKSLYTISKQSNNILLKSSLIKSKAKSQKTSYEIYPVELKKEAVKKKLRLFFFEKRFKFMKNIQKTPVIIIMRDIVLKSTVIDNIQYCQIRLFCTGNDKSIHKL